MAAAVTGSCHHARIPGIYAAAFGDDPWPDDWEAFDEFDPVGVFLAVGYLRSLGLDRVRLHVEDGNEPAIRVYRKFGFVTVAEEPGPGAAATA